MTRASTELELLSAYLDGQLDAQDSARVEQLLAADPAARARFDALKATDALARQVLTPAPEVSDALRNSVQAAIRRARAQSRQQQAEPRAKPERRGGLLAWLGIDASPRFAFAASTVVAMAGVLGIAVGSRMFAAPEGGAGFGVLVASGETSAALTRALSESASGKKVDLPAGARFEAVASFRDASGVLCREFKLEQATQPGALAVACRGTGGWSVNFATTMAGSGGGYTPAASPTAVLDAYVQAIGGSAPLSAQEEAKALSAR